MSASQGSATGLNLTASGSNVVVPGQNVTASFTLTNEGDEASTGPAIELVSVPGQWAVVDQSADGNVTWSEAERAWISTGSLAPGESLNVSVTFRLSDDAAPTEYYVSASASDAEGQADAAVETFPVGPTDAGNLTVESSTDDRTAPGRNATVDVTLRNDGDADSVAPAVGLALPSGWSVVDQSAGENVTYSDANVEWVSTRPLAPGESMTVSAVLRSANDTAPGQYYVSVRGYDANNQSATAVATLNVTEEADEGAETTAVDEGAEETTVAEEETTAVGEETTVDEEETTVVEAETTAVEEEAEETAEVEEEQETTAVPEETTVVEEDEEETTAVEDETTAAEEETTETEESAESQAQNISETVSATFYSDDEAVANVTLEVADSPEERAQGLMFRESLPENHGMVFVYEDAEPRSFWMKNTLIPLDMIFVAENGTVVDVEHADPPAPNASDEELERYTSDAPAKYVVELEQGFANSTGVEPGAEVEFDVSGTLEPNETSSGA